MNIDLIIFLIAFILFLPLAGALLYVWWKYGKGDSGVAIARGIFLIGAVILFGYMLVI